MNNPTTVEQLREEVWRRHDAAQHDAQFASKPYQRVKAARRQDTLREVLALMRDVR